MGNITQKQTKINHLARLPLVVLQLCFHPLDRSSRLRFSRTCHRCLKASQSPFAWKYAPPVSILVEFPSFDASIKPLLRFCYVNLVWGPPLNGPRLNPPSLHEIALVRHYTNIQSLTIKRCMTTRQLEALLTENDSFSHLQTCILDHGITGEIDFVQVGATFLTLKKLQRLILPHVRFTYSTYHAFMTELPELSSCGFTTFRTDDWTNDQIKSANEFEFTSKITHLRLDSWGVRPHQASSIALVNHLLSHVLHLNLEECVGTNDENFMLLIQPLTSVTHLVAPQDKVQLAGLLIQLAQSPAESAAPNLSHLFINTALYHPPSVGHLLTILTQRPHLQIRFHPLLDSGEPTNEQRRRWQRLFQPLEESVHANRFQLILPTRS